MFGIKIQAQDLNFGMPTRIIIPNDFGEFNPTSSLYVQGKKDADKYYKDYGPYAGSFFPSLVFPPAGFVSTIVISVIPPKEFNLGIPDDRKEVKSDPDYFNGYYTMAKRKKKLRTWAGFGTGTMFFTAGLLMFGYLHW